MAYNLLRNGTGLVLEPPLRWYSPAGKAYFLAISQPQFKLPTRRIAGLIFSHYAVSSSTKEYHLSPVTSHPRSSVGPIGSADWLVPPQDLDKEYARDPRSSDSISFNTGKEFHHSQIFPQLWRHIIWFQYFNANPLVWNIQKSHNAFQYRTLQFHTNLFTEI